jgi:excisionase family DNA binding protein
MEHDRMTNDNLEEIEMSLTKGKAKTGTSARGKARASAPPTVGAGQAAGGGEILTLAEAAEYLRVSQEDVVRSVGPTGLPGRRIGDDWRFLKSALQAWLATPPAPSSKEALASLAGAWKDDPYLDELRQRINADRERAAEDCE